jgi:hypothetical protein
MYDMELTDSNEKLLEGPEIVARSVQNTPGEYNASVSLAAIAAELTMPGIDVVQIGNTVFVGHLGKGKDSKKMSGRAWNVDTGRNFIMNGFKYFTYLQKRGITHYSTSFDGPVFLNAFRVFQKRVKQLDTEIGVGRLKNDPNTYVAFIRLGKEPLSMEV